MKYFFYVFLLAVMIYSCSSLNRRDNEMDISEAEGLNDTVRIANDSLEYEILIIDPGYSYFLHALAKPEGYYSLSYLENKNTFLVSDYNQRVQQPQIYDPSIYAQQINYDPQINYGYEVNYKLYNYFVYLARKYGEDFSVPVRL